ncbi:MAG TPA: SPOR domain-containing protein [candidate division Zixibacteria bacterium]|nr:SPOR domain-containing protein [candidate division Zixibacteria bacterium]
MDEVQDKEITLGAGKLLGFFFAIVALCAISFGIGYKLGRGSANPTPGSLIPEAGAQPAPTTGAPKPIAGQTATAKGSDCPTGTDCSQQSAATQDLSFYKAVEQKQASTQLTPPPEPVKAAPAELKPITNTGYMVQIAAVSKHEDAEVLRDALQRKQYPVVITQAPTDKFFHVQVGPFANAKDADAMRTRLVNDGYNPILKQ